MNQAKNGSVPRIEVETYRLPNGLRVILHPDRKLPVVHVNLWYHVGSKNEEEGKKYLLEPRLAISYVPEASRPADRSEPDRSVSPSLQPTPSFHVPPVSVSTLERIEASGGRKARGPKGRRSLFW